MHPSAKPESITPVPPAPAGPAQPKESETQPAVAAAISSDTTPPPETVVEGVQALHASPGADRSASGDSPDGASVPDGALASAATAVASLGVAAGSAAAAAVSAVNKTTQVTPEQQADAKDGMPDSKETDTSSDAAPGVPSTTDDATTVSAADEAASRQLSAVGVAAADSLPSKIQAPGYAAWADPLERSPAFDHLEALFQSRIAYIDGAMGTSIQQYKCEFHFLTLSTCLIHLRFHWCWLDCTCALTSFYVPSLTVCLSLIRSP